MDARIAQIVLSETFGDLSFAQYVQDGRQNKALKVIGYGAYASVLEAFQDSIEAKGLLWSNSQWDSWSNLATGAIAIIVMGEKPTQYEMLGYLLISCGIFLIGNNGSKVQK